MSSMPPPNPIKVVVPNGEKIYRKPNTPPTVGPQHNPAPGSNLPKGATRIPPTTGRRASPPPAARTRMATLRRASTEADPLAAHAAYRTPCWDVATLPAHTENWQGALPHHHPRGDLRGSRQRRAARTTPARRPDRDEDRKVHRHEYGVDASRKRIRRYDHLPSPLSSIAACPTAKGEGTGRPARTAPSLTRPWISRNLRLAENHS
jgi:hypothetical protein